MGDETYKLSVNLAAIFSHRVSHLIREYPLPKIKNFSRLPKTFIKNFFSVLRYPILFSESIIALIKGVKMTFSQGVILFCSKLYKVNVVHLPLGYTNEFAEFVSLNFRLKNKRPSILNKKDLVNENSRNRNNQLCFSGQEGQFDRRLMRAALSERRIEVGPFHKGYMGKGTNRGESVKKFCEGLQDSRYALCPAGTAPSSKFSIQTWLDLDVDLLSSIPDSLLSEFRNEMLLDWRQKLDCVKTVMGLNN
jgi:hypothetical protein